jgi:hypothetical protein
MIWQVSMLRVYNWLTKNGVLWHNFSDVSVKVIYEKDHIDVVCSLCAYVDYNICPGST